MLAHWKRVSLSVSKPLPNSWESYKMLTESQNNFTFLTYLPTVLEGLYLFGITWELLGHLYSISIPTCRKDVRQFLKESSHSSADSEKT